MVATIELIQVPKDLKRGSVRCPTCQSIAVLPPYGLCRKPPDSGYIRGP